MNITEKQAKAIAEIPYLRDGGYANLNLEGTLDFMRRRYIEPMKKQIDIEQATMADCAAGFGWLSFAFLLCGGKQAILIEPDKARIEAAEEIAEILGIHEHCRFENALLEKAGLEEDSVDVFCSIETLEHVGKTNVRHCVANIARAARRMVILTTPNKLFPVIAHDTRLPFAHWLPLWLIRPYAKMFGRQDKEQGNFFLAHWHLRPLKQKFRATTPYQTFATLDEFDAFYPHYLPYGLNKLSRHRNSPSSAQRMFVMWMGRLFGTAAYMVSPNLSTIWIRR